MKSISQIITILLFLVALGTTVDLITPRENDVFDLQKIDKDGDSLVSLSEFKGFIEKLNILSEHYSPQEIEELTFEAFNMFDKNSDGILEHG